MMKTKMQIAALCGLLPLTAAAEGFDWAGFYAGASLTITDTNLTGIQDCCEFDPGDDPDNLRPGGIEPGLHLGYNILRGQTVLGVEADITASQFSDRQVSTSEPVSNISTLEIDRFGSLRARAGRVDESGLLFLTLGASYADVTYTMEDPDGAIDEGSVDLSDWGYVIGAGFALPLTERTSLSMSYERHVFDAREDTSDLTSDSNPEDFVEFEGFDLLRFAISTHF